MDRNQRFVGSLTPAWCSICGSETCQYEEYLAKRAALIKQHKAALRALAQEYEAKIEAMEGKP